MSTLIFPQNPSNLGTRNALKVRITPETSYIAVASEARLISTEECIILRDFLLKHFPLENLPLDKGG